MVPAALAGEGGRRGSRIPPHSRQATRRTTGLEAAVVDHAPMTINALDPNDTRSADMEIAGAAALLVAKLHKLGERQGTPGRLLDKDGTTSTGCCMSVTAQPVNHAASDMPSQQRLGRR